MVASVIEELSPKDQRTKLLREKLAIIQEAQVSAVSAGFAAASNLQLLWPDVLLKNFGFQTQVLSQVRTAPFEGPHVLGPEPKNLQHRVRAIRQADRCRAHQWPSSRSPRRLTRRLGSPSTTTVQRTVSQGQSFRAGAGRGDHNQPYPRQRKKARTAPSASSARQRWRGPGGAHLADFAPQWRSLLGTSGHQHCRGRGGHNFQTFNLSNTSAHPSFQQLPGQEQPPGSPAGRGCPAGQGGHREG